MEKPKSKKKRRAKKPPLNVTGPLAMPREILAWERDLLAVVLEAFGVSVKQDEQESSEVPS